LALRPPRNGEPGVSQARINTGFKSLVVKQLPGVGLPIRGSLILDSPEVPDLRFDYNMPKHRTGKAKARTMRPERPYDPAIDGWNIHTSRHEPSIRQLLFRMDDRAADALEVLD
jgi:hypothetical protein